MSESMADEERPDLGASSSFESFYASSYRAAAKLAYLLCGSELVSEDLTQEAFMVVAAQFDSIDNPIAFLRTVLVRRSIDLHRRERRGRGRQHLLYRDQTVSEPDRVLFDVIARLPEAQRAVLALRYWVGMTFEEIASTLGCRVGTAKSHCRRALRALRAELEEP